MNNSQHTVKVGLLELLDNKEARVVRQNRMLAKYSQPLISLTINIPGPYKLTVVSKQIFSEALEAVLNECKQHNWNILGRQIIEKPTGKEAILSVDVHDSFALKKAMIGIEQSHRLGRLMDLDVCNKDGKMISRSCHEMSLRTCFICDKPAVICSRSSAHSLEELTEYIERTVLDDQCSS